MRSERTLTLTRRSRATLSRREREVSLEHLPERAPKARSDSPLPRAGEGAAKRRVRASAVAMLLLLLACSRGTTNTPTSPVNPSGARVIFPDGHVVRVELAADLATRAQGLMHRDRLPDGTGMLFIFPVTSHYSFWMKNTLIPLDMIWISEDRRVVHVKHGVPPCQADPCPSYSPGAPARYVLEVGSGVARAHGVDAGVTLQFQGLENVVVR
jgi:uncharacterized membrane protein (UPF0127 family)